MLGDTARARRQWCYGSAGRRTGTGTRALDAEQTDAAPRSRPGDRWQRAGRCFV